MVRAVNSVSYRYGCRSKIGRTTAKHYRQMVYKFRARSFRIFDQDRVGLSTFQSCFCNSTHRIWRSHVSMSMVYRPSFLGKANIGGELCLSCKVRKVVSFSSFKYLKSFACILASLPVNEEAMRVNFRTNRRMMLLKLMNEQSAVVSLVSLSFIQRWCVFLGLKVLPD